MTPKISLIIGIAVTALAFGVPTALAERQLVGSPEPDAVAYFYANERATLAQSDSPARQGDSPATAAFYANERATLAQSDSPARQGDSPATAAFYANERATLVEQGSSVGSRDHVRLDPNNAPSPAVSVSSGSEIEWPQLGIGFGFGILLVAGLWLTMRMTKGRPVAH
jgi:hypothetical protein